MLIALLKTYLKDKTARGSLGFFWQGQNQSDMKCTHLKITKFKFSDSYVSVLK
jgi:hypothetical protein